jgi:hypothetical protein
MRDLSSLAWELLASISHGTGRLLDDPPEVAHRRLVTWLSGTAENVAMSEAWLALSRTERPMDTSSQVAMREYAMEELSLRQPIEHAIWGEPAGGGIVGLIHSRRWLVSKWWSNRRH